MADYLKFWLAKELVPLIIFAFFALVCAGVVVLLVVLDKFQRWKRNRLAGKA